MFKKLFILMALVVGLSMVANEARAAGNYEVGYSTFGLSGVTLNTGSAAQINLTRPGGMGGVVMGYLIQNQAASEAIWVGGPAVSSDTAAGASYTELGIKVLAGGSLVWQVGKDPNQSTPALAPVYAIAADAAEKDGVPISVLWFGN